MTGAVGKTLGHRTVALAAAAELRRRILSGEFPESGQLRQDALAAEFGVSRIPIREALLQLEAEGLVRILPHRGAVVAALSVDEIEELFDLRALLEPDLLARSAPSLTREDFERLHGILDAYSTAIAAADVSRWGVLNTELHLLLYGHADRPRTLAIVTALLQNTDRYTRMQLSFTQGRERADREHRALVELCATGRIEEACALLRDHVRVAGRALAGMLRESRGNRPTG